MLYPIDKFIHELQALLGKYGFCLSSGADAADDTSLESWIEIQAVEQQKGRRPQYETVKKLDNISDKYFDAC